MVRLDRLACRDRRRLRLAGELEILKMRRRQRAIFVALRRKRGEPLFEIAPLERDRETLGDIRVGPRDRVDPAELPGIGITAGQRRGIA
jgi:hypothetical protein